MSEVISIRPADLRAIENNLGVIHGKLEALDTGLGTVNDNVAVVFNELNALASQFYNFVDRQMRDNRKGLAETRLVKIRAELKDKFGHYDVVRKTTTGILQANDLGIVKKETISNVTEELMLTTPNYWLTPCLIALAAWINDQRELAERALKEGIRRNDEKTSLFWALVCRRAGRKEASLKWAQRYLENQDEEALDRNTIVVLDAYASGLLGADVNGIISQQMTKWLDHLTEKEGFVDQQIEQWSAAINLKKEKIRENSYPYLRRMSKTWPALENIMEGAELHATILAYFMDIFSRTSETGPLEAQLDQILNSLVTDFDNEELSFRKEEKFEQLVVDSDGDEKTAKEKMDIEKTAFEEHKDFTQLLTDAAMKAESANASVSTQKFAIALSRNWIRDAYKDIVEKNRKSVPNEIQLKIDDFQAVTTDGGNEEQILNAYEGYTRQEEDRILSGMAISAGTYFCLFGGILLAGLIVAQLSRQKSKIFIMN